MPGRSLALRAVEQEVLGQPRDVFAPRAQRRQLERHDVQAVVEIGAKRAFGAGFRQILVGRGDHAHVDLERAAAADALDLPLLQDAQQLGLHRERHVADLVQEQRAAAGALELAAALLGGAGERARFVAEELALDQLGGHRGAVQALEDGLGAR